MLCTVYVQLYSIILSNTYSVIGILCAICPTNYTLHHAYILYYTNYLILIPLYYSILHTLYTYTGMANIAAILKPAVAARKKNIVVTREVLQQSLDASIAKDNDNKGGHNSDLNAAGGGKSGKGSTGFGGLAMKKSVSTGFLSSLAHHGESTPKDSPKTTEGGQNYDPLSPRQVRSAALADSLKPHTTTNTTTNTLHKSTPSTKRFTKLEPFRKTFVLTDTTRDRLRDELKSLFTNIRNLLRVNTTIHSSSIGIIYI